MRDHATYIARVEHDAIRVYTDDWESPVGKPIPLPLDTSLRQALLDAGWQPTGRRARGGWGSIYVTPAEGGARLL